ncbi:LysR substrate-binding domain-containing protein [Tabrizicola sp.]|uniref:LysR substrate-binding domain-containing protein n=1 Tax=Tabrizicola sp. TaxID=2005166 RepID=UPI002734AA3A|nr:LysR substrate-binding domain-containing protein [Tabrizicola sp.]MDP3197725.1 LysR substrate-binding domain-containing protein [Tabrizicola sp.]
MPSLRRSVPSMSALATFEAAARLGSFTLAAAELGVTQAAVSRQIKLLEDDLNLALFVRAHRRVSLTQAGTALSGSVGTAFSSMAEMIDTIRRPQQQNTVTLGATLAFSHFWILPRLSEFRAAHPEITLKLLSDDGPTDLRRDRLDAVVRFGRPPFLDGHCIASRPDTVFPVCSSQLIARLHIDPERADLAALPLIASDIVAPSWLTWGTWAQAVGLGSSIGRASDRSSLRFNHYTDTIEAALNGEGVALGWSMLLANHLREGRLVRLGSHALETENSYCLVVARDTESRVAATAFTSWLKSSLSVPLF